MKGRFNLRKWRTNDEDLRKFINAQEEISSDVIGPTGDKVLGITWDEIQDELVIDLTPVVEEAVQLTPTKRNVLKVIASIYDPLGFLQPIVVNFKILFQMVWVTGIGWDEVISDDLKTHWFEILEAIKTLGKLRIPRSYCYSVVSDPVVTVELHGFSDASEVAYACCIYLKFVTRSG